MTHGRTLSLTNEEEAQQTTAGRRVIVAELSGLTLPDLHHDLHHDLTMTSPPPSYLAELSGLTLLDLRANQLTSLPPAGLGGLTALATLLLDANRLAALPPSVGCLARLRRLETANNQLASLPAELGALDASLTRLDASGNALAALPAALGRCAALVSLRLSSNKLVSPLPCELGALQVCVCVYVCAAGRGATTRHEQRAPAPSVARRAALRGDARVHSRRRSPVASRRREDAMSNVWRRRKTKEGETFPLARRRPLLSSGTLLRGVRGVRGVCVRRCSRWVWAARGGAGRRATGICEAM